MKDVCNVARGHGESSTQEGQEGVVQLLTPAGERLANPRYDPFIADIDDERLLQLYQELVIVRRIDAEATALQRQGEIGLWPPLQGQEAAQLGSAHALRADDFVFASYREHAVAYYRGAGPADLVRMWRGTAGCGWDPYSLNMSTQIVIGSQALHAAGYALGCRNDGADCVAVTYFGDGATSQGDTSEALVFAASFQAPVLFFCQNNRWAISEPVELQARRPLVERGPGFGIPGVSVDGNDVLACLAVTRKALDHIREGGGPRFIEALTYRMGPHTTADDPTRYRDVLELEEWAARDPILRVRRLLEARGQLTPEREAEVAARADAVECDLREACIDMPDPDPLTVFDHVYATEHSALAEQRNSYRRYLAMFEGEG